MSDEQFSKDGVFLPVLSMRRAVSRMEARAAIANAAWGEYPRNTRMKDVSLGEPFSTLSINGHLAMDSFVSSYSYACLTNSGTVSKIAAIAVATLTEFNCEWILEVKKYLDDKYLGKDIRDGITEEEAVELGCFITNVNIAANAIESRSSATWSNIRISLWHMAKDNARHMFAVAPQREAMRPMVGITRSIYPQRDNSNEA